MISRWKKMIARRRQMNVAALRSPICEAGPAEFQTLEPRLMMSVTAAVDGMGALTISSDAADSIAITVDGVTGNVLINGVDPGSGAALATSITSINITGDAGANTINLSGVTAAAFTALTDGSVVISAGDGIDTITGSEFADTITGGAGDDAIDGGLGADVLVETITAATATLSDTGFDGNGTDTLTAVEEAQLTGTAGDDTIIAASFTGAVTINGLAGNDTITGGSGADTLDGGDGDDTLNGGAGTDTLSGGNGVNTIDGGADQDTITFAAAAGRVHAMIRADGTGHARVNVVGQGRVERTNHSAVEVIIGSAFSDNLVSCIDGGVLQGGDGNDVLRARRADGNSLTGGDGDDRLFGGGILGVLQGGLGNDRLHAGGGSGGSILDGGDGDDRLWGSRFDDTLLDAGAGNDRVWGGGGDDFLVGGLGDDDLRGGIGNDQLDAEDGIDRIFGQGGDDILNGGLGDDYLHGGAGPDTLDGGDDIDTARSDADDTLLNIEA